MVGDFETTVYKCQTATEVWASACVELYTEDVKIFNSIGAQFEYFKKLKSNIVCYYHNLKFDGSFWLSFLMIDLGLKQAGYGFAESDTDTPEVHFDSIKDMPNNSFIYSISGMGQWYRIILKIQNKIIELRDSLKLLPFSVDIIGKSFATKYKKLTMEYRGFRYAGCEITDEEKRYIANDVLVVKEAIEIMHKQGHTKLTIGSCCLAEYKKTIGFKKYQEWFPNLYTLEIDEKYGAKNAGEYVRKSYRGGWCYLVRGKEKKIYHTGCTYDVNSLYPSMMSSESGNMYPVGMPTFWKGNYVPDEAIDGMHYYFVRFKTRFYIKENMLPFIQIKNTFTYRSNEMLETSDWLNHADGKYYPCYYDTNGKLQEAIVTLTMTMTDFRLLTEHYELVDFEILDGCYFKGAIGIFDTYINKYKEIKMNNKGAIRELAKLFLNNLYGKMASSTNSNFKVAYVKPDKTIGFYTQEANDKEPGYIPVGSAITSYARNFTIRAAQMNYHGVNTDGFVYADTDSIHCSLPADKTKGIKVHTSNFCCWKLESKWNMGYFVRQKTYAERVIETDKGVIERPYIDIKCAGMPERCKNLFINSLNKVDRETSNPVIKKSSQYEVCNKENYSSDELDFLTQKRTIKDFNVGLVVPGKLLPKRIRGGVLLVETTYEMR